MILLSLGANKNTFHPIQFKDGINIIVGKQVAPHDKNDGNTYNGVGKSLIIHLIHFCLGSNKIDANFIFNRSKLFISDRSNYFDY